MRWLDCSLLVIVLYAAFCIGSAAQTEATKNAADKEITVYPKENEVNFPHTDFIKFESFSTEETFQDPVLNLTLMNEIQNLTNKENVTSMTTSVNGQTSLVTNQKQDVENGTFTDITPFLLFPILPFLFPPRVDKASFTGKDNLPSLKNDSKAERNPAEIKPFIFFDFAFNIRGIPLKNRTERSNDSQIIEKNLALMKADGPKQSSQKNRQRRNTNTKINTLGFFDDSPLFPDSELDEFLPKPDLFFPDLPFHHKSVKKLNRRKRDQKKPDLKSDLKLFFEAFMKTKREIERTDPFLNLFREAEQSFNEGRKRPDEIFSPVSEIQEKPSMKWRIQRNIKRLKNGHQDDLTKAQESPMIIVDKVVKIGEFHVRDDGHDKNKVKKGKKKKRDGKDSKNKVLGTGNHGEITLNRETEVIPKNIFELIKQEESKKKSRNHNEVESYVNVGSKEIKVLPQMNTSALLDGSNATLELKNKLTPAIDLEADNTSGKTLKYGNLLKVVDSLKSKIKVEPQSAAAMEPAVERLKRKGSMYDESAQKRSYEDLKKNVTELIEQFLAVVKKFDDPQLAERSEPGERENEGIFDWTEKETLQNSDANFIRKDPRGRRQKKDAEIEKEFIELGKKERRVTDLNYLFLTVTLPTVFVFALVLLVCFFNLQIKGKICTKLFRPRQIFLVEEEAPSQFVYKNPSGAKKIQNM